MSWKAMAAVWDLTEGIESSEKWLLFTLAYKLNDETGECDPSVTYLAKRCRLSERRTRDLLHVLEGKGFIRISRKMSSRGDFSSNQYELLCVDGGGAAIAPPLFVEDVEDCPRVGQPLPQGGAAQGSTGGAAIAPGWGNSTSDDQNSNNGSKSEPKREVKAAARGAASPPLSSSFDDLKAYSRTGA